MSRARLDRLLERLPLSPEADEGREWFGIVGAVGIAAFVVIALFGSWMAPYPTDATPGQPFESPSADHLLGTDDTGHDIFSWLLVGARVSMLVGFVAGSLAILSELLVGITAGVVGGRVETTLMRFVDVVLTLPFLPLVVVVAAVFGPSTWTTVGVLATVMWARPARELRSEVLSIRNREYIEVSRSMGASKLHVALRYVVPAVLLIAIAQFARVVSMAILLEASLSFLGLGDPTSPSWGTMLFYAQQRSAFLTGAWKWWVIPPGLAITLSVLSFIFLTLGIERRTGASRQSISTDLESADFDVVHTDSEEPTVAAGGDAVRADGVGATEADPVLQVSNLTVEYGDGGETVAVDDVSLDLRRDELLGVVGESGSGKSSFALALLDLLRAPGRVTAGRIRLRADRDGDRPVELADVRGDEIAFVPQEAMNALDPRLRLDDQIVEAIRVHRSPGRDCAEELAHETLSSVGLPPESHDRYPFELSGGMRQRGVVAMALVNDPSVLVVDEPTTGLDIVTKANVLRLLEEIQSRRELSVVVISHDLSAVVRVADRIAVMHEGRFVEVGETARLQSDPDHSYTRKLLDARTVLPSAEDREGTERRAPSDPHLVYDEVSKTFDDERVLDGVDLTVDRGRSVALLGESGAGKSTLGRMALGLVAPDKGTIRLDGEAVGVWRSRDARGLGQTAHCLFQDPYSSLAPNRRVLRTVQEPLDIHDRGEETARVDRVYRALEEVELTPAEEYAERYPSELSGGERQRVAFARALVLDPSVLVADEPTSMLDAPLQRGLLELLYDLVDERGITLLHITHNVAQAATFADEVAVLHDGSIVEQASTATILRQPNHLQTRKLVEAAATLSGVDQTDSVDTDRRSRR